MSEYVIDQRFSSRAERTARVLEIAEAFGIGLAEKEFVIYDNLKLEVAQGDVVYITGQSGSGKSLMLRQLSAQMKEEGKSVALIEEIELRDEPLIEQIGESTNDALRLLSLAGLNDAYLFIRKPSELSDGQRYRFRLAKLIERQTQVWVADEFGAVLDRVTARVVAFNAQKIARQAGATLLTATTHTDLKDDLRPSLYIEKRFRERIKVEVDHDAG